MYKFLKLAIDLLFLIVSIILLAYLYLFNPSRPTCDQGEALLALSRIAWMPQDASPPMPVTAGNETTHRNPIPTEATHG
ncbi:MAG: hypothetical protein RKR03_10505 [Candidatus Competibacter sp.]|nr:hypothetical protein [Candidatus Competibacter sp.]